MRHCPAYLSTRERATTFSAQSSKALSTVLEKVLRQRISQVLEQCFFWENHSDGPSMYSVRHAHTCVLRWWRWGLNSWRFFQSNRKLRWLRFGWLGATIFMQLVFFSSAKTHRKETYPRYLFLKRELITMQGGQLPKIQPMGDIKWAVPSFLKVRQNRTWLASWTTAQLKLAPLNENSCVDAFQRQSNCHIKPSMKENRVSRWPSRTGWKHVHRVLLTFWTRLLCIDSKCKFKYAPALNNKHTIA